MLKLTSILLALAAVVALSLLIDANSRLATRQASPTLPPAAAEIHAPGRVEGATEEIDLRARLFGRVEEVLVHEGQRVAAGDVLVRIDAEQEKYECAAAEAAVATAEAELDRVVEGARPEERRAATADVEAIAARLESARQRRLRIAALHDRGASTAQELDELTAEVKSLAAQADSARARHDLIEAPAREEDVRRARANVAAAQARLGLARNECCRAEIRAPLAAEVLRVQVQVGEMAGPESDDPALVLADTSRLFVRAYVDEIDAPRLSTGMPARVTADGLAGSDVRGTIVRLAPRMTQKPLRTDDPLERFDTKVREVWIELEPSGTESLVVGLPVDVVLEAEQPTILNPEP